ncbi:MAG: hypothetical protein E7362_01425 [Clostridiales bacterium]|nr:hypothetical protein [Clostridiales bacterium]
MKNPKLTFLFLSAVLCLVCVLSFFSTNQTVNADAKNFGRIITEDTIFYKDEVCSIPLFFLPYTYYVKVLNETPLSYHVEYGGDGTLTLDGYVKKDSLFFDGLSVENPFPKLSLTTLCTAVLYQNPDSTLPIQYVFENRNLTYYGSYVNLADKRVFCVSYNGNFGFIAEETVQPFSLPFHPNELTFIIPDIPTDSPQDSIENSTENPSSDLIIKITVIGCLLFAGVISLFIAISSKKKTKPPKPTFYDENDYE